MAMKRRRGDTGVAANRGECGMEMTMNIENRKREDEASAMAICIDSCDDVILWKATQCAAVWAYKMTMQ